MAGDGLKTASSGDRFPFDRDYFNLSTDAIKRSILTRRSMSARAIDTRQSPGDCLIQNQSGQTIPNFGVLGIRAEMVIDASMNLPVFQYQPVLIGTVPTTPLYTGFFVIADGPIANQAIGRAWISGCCPVQVFMNNATDEYADVKNGDITQLSSGSSGAAKILYCQGTSGTQWAYVQLGQSGPGFIPVTLSNDGGSGGTPTAYPSWTYTVYPFGGTSSTPLGTKVPYFARPPCYYYVKPASTGIAFTGNAGDGRGNTLQIMWCNEAASLETCISIVG